MNILQSLEAKPDFLVTLNGVDEINPSKIIKKVEYTHPLFTVDGIHAQKKKNQINGTITHIIVEHIGEMVFMKTALIARWMFVRLLESRYESF